MAFNWREINNMQGRTAHSSRIALWTSGALLAAILLTVISGCGLTSGSNGGASSLAITTASLPNGQSQTIYNASLSATGGKRPYNWSIVSGALPTGLALASSNGAVFGKTSQTGNFAFTVQVTDASSPTEKATQRLNLTVKTGGSGGNPSLAITTLSLPGAQMSQPYSVTLAATGGQTPYTWGVASGAESLPPGLTLATSTGAISGTPSATSAYTFTVEISDSSSPQQTDTHTYILSTLGVTLDQYGGREDIKCATVTPYFHLEKISNHWMFCDPLGNGFISMSVSNVVTNGNPTPDCAGNNTYPIYIAKYGDTTSNWGWQTLKRITTWGFNSIGQDSSGNVLPWQTCSNCVWPGGTQPVPLPYISELKPAEHASINQFGYLGSPIKDEISGTNSNYTAWRGGALFDVFDPGLNTEWQKELASSGQPALQQILTDSPYLLGVFTDDSDYFWGSGAGPDFASGHTNSNIAWITLITSPVQTYIQSTPYANETSIYLTTQVYSKTMATSPTTPCSISSPCSLRDYLWQKYGGNIANLNTAWGSNYTTFGSTGTQINGELVATGNGSTNSFSHTLTHGSVSPFSVLISVGGAAQIGDCPWFQGGCGTITANSGLLGSPTAGYITQASSTIDYSTGLMHITFAKAPANGASITVNYIYDGWMAGGTGLMDEDGSHSAWVGTNPYCLEGADPNYPFYYSCTGAGGNSNPIPNANSNLATDLDNWIPQFSAEYFKTMSNGLKAVSSVPYFGLDTIGSYGTPSYSKFLQGAAPYIDGAFVSLALWNQSQTEFDSRYKYTTQYIGDIPIMTFNISTSQTDSSMSCYPHSGSNDSVNQATRGTNWNNDVQYLLTNPGFNGSIQVVGFDWWSWQDFQNLNQGLVSIHDNAYDGHEAVLGTAPCSSPLQSLSCGGESANYGDAITQIKIGNLFWILQ